YASDFWVIDLDGVLPDKGATDRETIERCLPFLKSHGYVYAYSQSAGFKEGLRVRVVCRTAPMTLADRLAYARYYNDILFQYEAKQNRQYIDSSIYQVNKLVYTARPKMACSDPHLVRVFKVEGDEVAVLD